MILALMEKLMKTKEPKFYRHGDLLIRRIETSVSLKSAKQLPELTVALGEATGHHHTLYRMEPSAFISMLEQDAAGVITRFMVSGAPSELRHQEHKTLTIEPGQYEIVREREWDYFENDMKRVVD